MSQLIRSPLILTIDAGAVRFAPVAVRGIICECHQDDPMLVVPSDNDLVSVAGNAEDIRTFAYGLLSAVQTYHYNEQERTK